MSGTWKWIVIAVALALVGGASLGVVADRVMLRDRPARPGFENAPEGTIWFDCSLTAQESRHDPAQRAADHRAWRDQRLADMREDLGLDDAQVTAIAEVFDDHRDLAHDYWDRTREEYCGMRESLRQGILEQLRPEQRGGFEERLRRIDERARARLQAPPPPTGDPR
jgi:hypothetical protein